MGGEITSARGRDVKIFRNEDCTYTALYGHYLHYEKAPGQWEDVDLNFRQEGTAYVMDRHDIEVRITGSVLKATERHSGKGIRWVMPTPPVVAGRSARFSAGGLQWEYSTRKSGLKLSANVPVPLGQRTWEFPFLLSGGATNLSLDEEGNLVSDVFSVPRPFALGADGNVYDVSQWRIIQGSRVAFDFDDSGLPLEAFPYELDPTTTFSVASGTDDGYVTRTGSLYPPVNITDKTGASTNTPASSTSTTIGAMRSVTNFCPAASASSGGSSRAEGWSLASAPLCPLYEIRNALMRWNTSALPDTAVITGATLRAYVSAKYNDDARSLDADWYNSGPIDSYDYRETAQTSAIYGHSIASITTGADNDFPLSNPSFYVSKTGYTGLRLHVSGGQPDGRNQVDIRAYESTTSPEPRLLVTYSTPPAISAVGDSPDPVTAGDPLTFTASWTDADPGDSVRAVICKTNQISSGSCPGGYWGYGNLSTTSPSTASFTPTALHHGTQTYHAFACDAAGACSSSLSRTFTVLNRVPTITTISDGPDPVRAGNPVTFTAWWSDPGDTARVVICKTDQVSSGTCPGGAWAIGGLSYGPSTASFTPWNIAVGNQAYYAFVCDAAGACSSSLSATFQVTQSLLILDDLLAVVAQQVPGFGGAYVDEDTGELFVWLTNPSQGAASSAQSALIEVLGDPGLGDLAPVPLQAQYGWLQLNGWINQITSDVMSVPGTVSTDIDDDRNRLVIGMENVSAQGPAVAAVVAHAGVPAEAVIFEQRQAPEPSGLRHHNRPLVGGLQVEMIVTHDGGSEEEHLGTCTLGFNAVRPNGESGFVTASHCTAVQWKDDRTMFWQPAFQPADPVTYMVGDETHDPLPFTHAHENKCPVHMVCRFSEVSFVTTTPGVTRDQGRVARPDQMNTSNWDGTTKYSIVQQLSPIGLEGETVVKVGKQTGRTNGVLTNACFHTGYRGKPNIFLICQSEARYDSAIGDSGAPVFKQPGDQNPLNIKLLGIHWGRNRINGVIYSYFSGVNQIKKPEELGPLSACVSGC